LLLVSYIQVLCSSYHQLEHHNPLTKPRSEDPQSYLQNLFNSDYWFKN
jgi:hypothetical protein